MSERRQRFNAIQERVNELEQKAKNAKALSASEKRKLMDEALRCGIGLANLALEQMEAKEMAPPNSSGPLA